MTLRLFFVVALFLLNSCGVLEDYYISKYDFSVYNNNTPGVPQKEEILAALDKTMLSCNIFVGKPCDAAINGYTLEWWGVVAVSPSTGVLTTVVIYGDKLYSGLTTFNDSTIRVAWRGRIHRSAFVHEIAHLVGIEAFSVEDREHTLDKLWLWVSSVNKSLSEVGF